MRASKTLNARKLFSQVFKMMDVSEVSDKFSYQISINLRGLYMIGNARK
jgi:hypothetical protein